MNRKRKYVLKLTVDERAWLEGMVRTGKSAAWKIRHAHALLKMDQGEDGPGWDDARIAEAFGMTVRSLENWHKRAVEDGPAALFERHCFVAQSARHFLPADVRLLLRRPVEAEAVRRGLHRFVQQPVIRCLQQVDARPGLPCFKPSNSAARTSGVGSRSAAPA